MSQPQTIREVLIRVALRSDSSGFKTPDFKKHQSAYDELAAATGKAADEQDRLNQSMRKSGSSGGSSGQNHQDKEARRQEAEARREESRQKREQEKRDRDAVRESKRQEVEAAREAARQKRDLQMQEIEGERAAKARLKSLVDEEIDQQKALRDEYSAGVAYKTSMLDAEMQRADAINQTVTAVTKLARGYAFLTAASDEDYQKALQWIAGAQGAMDILTGTVDMYKTYINIKKLSIVTTTAEITAENALAAARARSAAAGMMGGGGGRGAGGAAGGAMADFAGAAAGSALGGMGGKGLLSNAGQYAKGALRVAGLPVALATAGYYISKGFLDDYTQQQDAMQRPTYGADQSTAEWLENQRAQSRDAFELQINRTRDYYGIDRSQDQRAYGRGSLGAQSVLEREERRLKDMQYSLFRQRFGTAESTQLEDASKRLFVEEQKTQSMEYQLGILEKEEQLMRQQIAGAEEVKRLAYETLEAEERRYQSQEERIGRLSESEARRLRAIADKQRNGGELSLREARFLESVGVGSAQAAARFRSEGQSRDAQGILSAFGEDKSFEQAKRAYRDAINIQNEGAKELRAQLEKNIKAQDEFHRELGKGLARIVATKEEVAKVLKAFEQEVQARRNSQMQNRGL